jgi:hypothetical protein
VNRPVVRHSPTPDSLLRLREKVARKAGRMRGVGWF